jgi:hypothetical protein
MTKEERIEHLNSEIERLEEERPRGYAQTIAEYRKTVRTFERDQGDE